MFENYSFDYLMERMIERVKNIDSAIDTSEGSLIYTALAATAWELAQNYINMDTILNMAFADTAPREELILRAKEWGIEPKEATKAVRKGVFNTEIPIGSRFTLDELGYIASERIDTGIYKMQCDTAGSAGNKKQGELTPSEYIEGLESAALTEILVPGEDEEATEDFRSRYFSLVQRSSTSGNANHYRQWALEVSGVGDAKIFPLWKGPGTVKVVIVDNDKKPATEALLSDTAQYIEQVRPVGAKITVVSGQAKAINISAALILASGYSLQAAISSFTEAMTNYFHSIAFTQSYVSLAKLGTILLGTEGVTDYSNLKLNGSSANIALADEEIPSLGAVELGV